MQNGLGLAKTAAQFFRKRFLFSNDTSTRKLGDYISSVKELIFTVMFGTQVLMMQVAVEERI